MDHLLRIADLDATELTLLLDVAALAKENPHRFSHVLEGDSVAFDLARPSARMRIPFETAVTRLGGTSVTTGSAELQFGCEETIEDTARVISRYARAVVLGPLTDAYARSFADAATVPVVNALTERHYPCHALADLLTLRERFGRLHGLKVAYLGEGNNVANSLMEACALAGVDIAIATPPGYEVDRDAAAVAGQLAERSGTGVLETHDPLLAAAEADAVYTGGWGSSGSHAEQIERRTTFGPYRVDLGVMGVASSDAVFMHCLPAHRGQEVAATVIDGPRSVVFEQAENMLYTAMAVLVVLLGFADHGDTFEIAGLEAMTNVCAAAHE